MGFNLETIAIQVCSADFSQDSLISEEIIKIEELGVKMLHISNIMAHFELSFVAVLRFEYIASSLWYSL